MPCGGIVPIGEVDVKGKVTEQLSPTKGGCWVCSHGGAHHFCYEWDTYIHARCVPAFLMGPEGGCVIQHGHEVILNFELEPDVQPIKVEGVWKTEDGLWHFENEGGDLCGPYLTREACEWDSKRYAESLNVPSSKVVA